MKISHISGKALYIFDNAFSLVAASKWKDVHLIQGAKSLKKKKKLKKLDCAEIAL